MLMIEALVLFGGRVPVDVRLAGTNHIAANRETRRHITTFEMSSLSVMLPCSPVFKGHAGRDV